MDNTMDININSGNNSMNSLTFTWKAIFPNGSIIEQFENGIINKFDLNWYKTGVLSRFSLVNKDYSKYFTVDLQNGFIIYNNYENIEIKEKKQNIRLIYFRRIRKEIGEQDLKEKSCTTKYHLGMQWNDSLGNNQKIILIIDEEGNWVIGE